MKTKLISCKFVSLLCISICLLSACNTKDSFTAQDRAIVQDSVRLMADSIAWNISHNGPVAWLDYFENSPEFFMATNGQLVFPNIDTATRFINNVLIKIMPEIKLQWSNIRIDPLTKKLACMSAVYHEDITDNTGKSTPFDGYFTGIARQTSQGWKLLNAHWSSLVTH